MSAESLKKVTVALDARLKAVLSALSSPLSTFVGPLDDPAAASAGLVLFLYRIAPNANLRNCGHTVTPEPARPGAAPGALVYPNALALDLHYLLTIGPKDQQAGESESLRLLGYAMRALNDSPVLHGQEVDGQTVRLSLEPPGNDEMSRVWALFPTVNYRTSVLYLASPVWIDPAAPVPTAASVTTQRFAADALEDKKS